MKEGVKRTTKFIIAFLLALTLAVPPVLGFPETVDAEEQADSLTLSLDGMTVSEVQADEQMAPLLDDPLFNRYYITDEEGVIHSMEMVDEEVCSENGITLNGASLASATHPDKYSKKAGYGAIRCIDVSNWQGVISVKNWKKVRDAGVRRVILRCGFTYQKDKFTKEEDAAFRENMQNAWKAGMIIGVYYYSQATTKAEAEKEANYTLSLIQDFKKKITLPVVYDFEWGGRLNKKYADKKGKDYMTEICETYCDIIKDAGYEPMIYASYSVLVNNLRRTRLSKQYKIWLAHYTSKGKATDYPGTFYLWQYTSSGKVNGLDGRIDMNYIYEYGRFIKQDNGDYKYKENGEYLSSVWLDRAGAVYRINKDGIRLEDCYKKISNYYYGFDKTGVRYRGVTASIDDQEHEFLYCGKAVIAVKVTKCKVNARVTTSRSSKVKKTYPKDTKVRITRVSKYGNWSKNASGYWMWSNYLKDYE